MNLYKLLKNKKQQVLAEKVLRATSAEYYTTFRMSYPYKADVEVFINPTAADLKAIREATNQSFIRFAVDRKAKKLYAWNGNQCTHTYMIDKLGLYELSSKDLITGAASSEGSYLKDVRFGTREPSSSEDRWLIDYFKDMALPRHKDKWLSY